MVDSATGRVALLSIHPRFADAILSGEKQVEFRRRAPSAVTHVVVYATAPVQRIVGWFRVGSVEAEAPSVLWARFGEIGGVGPEEFARYYHDCETGSAIRVADVCRLDSPVAIDAIGLDVTPPQSFRYVEWGRFVALLALAARPAGA